MEISTDDRRWDDFTVSHTFMAHVMYEKFWLNSRLVASSGFSNSPLIDDEYASGLRLCRRCGGACMPPDGQIRTSFRIMDLLVDFAYYIVQLGVQAPSAEDQARRFLSEGRFDVNG